ncbi:hypothetical protein QVD17_36690 [Tagetes erecta]|nr:hypothetical protein QVD17_36690 [Tagetes erecta]
MDPLVGLVKFATFGFVSTLGETNRQFEIHTYCGYHYLHLRISFTCDWKQITEYEAYDVRISHLVETPMVRPPVPPSPPPPPDRHLPIHFHPNLSVDKMSTPSRKRLMRDFKRLQQDPPAGISGAPYDNNIMLWNAVIFGPDDTPWDGGTFKLTLQFSEDYPNKPPTVRFISRMFHPNIYADGSICLDILQNQWSPIYDVAAILTSIQSLLCDPNPNSPANSEAARLFSENKREYNRKVREVVEQSWTAD